LNERRTAAVATAVLVGVTAAWGSTFFMIKDLLDRVPVLDFLAVRFALAAAVMFLLAPRSVTGLGKEASRHAIVLGALYGTGQILQTAGLAHTSASVSGFITGMYVIATPVFASWLLRTRIPALTWFAVALATAGLGVLTLRGFSMGYGEGLTLIAAMLYALHIVGLGAWSRPDRALGMSIVQITVIAAICFVVTIPDGMVLPHTGRDWFSVIYMALVAGALGLLGQTWAQAHLAPTRVAIIMSMEPVFAAFFAVLLGGESLTGRMLLGGAFVLAAMILVEARPGRRVEGEVTHLAT
jgi:drug/metabolite transporter (DMT)-like permease